MKVTIVSRIFAPEVSAASGLLLSWANEFQGRGHDVTVVTSRPPRGMQATDPPGIRVRRAPVVRDQQQYVRGYLSYLSFDVPLLFRLLFSRKPDLYVVEPPPTTVAVVRVVSAVRRVPYVVDAADLWSDAAAMATSSRFVLWSLRVVEKWALNGARLLLAAHEPLVSRFRELGIDAPTIPIGFGADTEKFHYTRVATPAAPRFVYAGTYSEWHGAGIFIEAFPAVIERFPDARLQFIGNGQERAALQSRIAELGLEGAVSFLAPIPPDALSPLLSAATASLASLKPGQGYDYAFTTKVYSSLAAGCPVVFAGVGPTVRFLQELAASRAGEAVDYDVTAVSAAMMRAAESPLDEAAREKLSTLTSSRYSLSAVASTVVEASLGAVSR